MFLLCIRLSPQAKDLICKLSALRTVQYLDPQKQIGRTSSGENSLFSPLAGSKARSGRQSPFLSETLHSAVCVSQRSQTKERGLWFTPKSILESYAVQRDAARPNANSFFEKQVTGKHTKKEFGRTSRGKSGFPSVPLESSFF